MKNPNQRRSSSGKFGSSVGTKAKPIQVWLQPSTIELLDTLTAQWGVGRGRVIEQLLTRGPVPPSSWEQVQDKPEPVADQPPDPVRSEPEAEPAELEPPVLAEPGPQRFSVGDQVIHADGRTGKVLFCEVLVDFTAKRKFNACQVRWGNSKKVVQHPEEELKLKPEPKPDPKPEAKPKPEPEPTHSGPSPEFQELLFEMERQGKARWDQIKRDAKAAGPGITADDVSYFKSRHGIEGTRPLSVDAIALLQQEVEAEKRRANAQKLSGGQRRAAIMQRLEANPRQAEQIRDLCAEVKVDGKLATEYLLKALPCLGIKAYRKLCPGLWKALPDLKHVNTLALALDDIPGRKALFWGVILRLDQLPETVPTEHQQLLDWCQANVYAQHRERLDDQRWRDVRSFFQGQHLSETEARKVLGLPQGIELTPKALKDAYRSKAREHHPDQGGDPARMQFINEAYEHLKVGL